jgi:hypothetical protein
MDSEVKPQKHVDRLARMRENQRKSRARKQEYVRELEQRLATFQEDARQTDIENRIALQKMEAENQHMKNLLMLLGFSASSIQHHLRLGRQDTVADCKVAITALKGPVVANPAPPFEAACPKSSQMMSSGPKKEDISVGQPLLNDSVPLSSTVPTHESTEQPHKRTISPSCSTTTERVTSETPPPGPNLFNTTSCAVADEFLARYNARGVDRDVIRRRVCPGFEESRLDRCRVQNTVVFQTLDEISDMKLS